MVTFGDIINRRKADGVSRVLVDLHTLMCGVVSWVMYHTEMH